MSGYISQAQDIPGTSHLIWARKRPPMPAELLRGTGSMSPISDSGEAHSRSCRPLCGPKSRLRIAIAQCTRALLIAMGVTCLSACLSSPAGSVAAVRHSSSQYQAIPGGAPYYSWGGSQKMSEMDTIQIAQSSYAPFRNVRSWTRITPSSRAHARIVGLRSFYPLHVRWRLKNGREFLLENVDVESLVQEHSRANQLLLQWQREKRAEATGDYGPLLAHEVDGDAVLIKWVLTINRTPVSQRLTKNGAANTWDLVQEEYLVARIPGVPVSGIDFNSRD